MDEARLDFENISPISVSEEMSKSFLDYSMSVIISRALPDARDGLKPSQRRILYAMRELNLSPGRPHTKCAKICGDTSGNYHPHGESVVYPTLVNMAQPWSMREPLIDGQGNFGSVEGDPPAAMRYTEARLTHLGALIMEDLDKDTVNFVPNYNEQKTEPTVFPAAFPNLLVNGGSGIAVGMATNIPPHNLGELIDGICAQIDNPQITIQQLRKHILGPDFPTGCSIIGSKGIEQYTRTGRGSMRVRGSVMIEELRPGREAVIITEIPYGVNRATLHERIGQLVNEKILENVASVRDESDENTRLVIELRRDGHPQIIVNNLFKHTQLQTNFSANMLAIDGLRPRILSIKDAIDCYIEHRREVVLRRTRYLLRKAQAQAEILEAYLIAVSKNYLDDFIRLIRDSDSRAHAAERLKTYDFSKDEAEKLGILIHGQASWHPQAKAGKGIYKFTTRQIDAILNLRLYQLTAMERDKVKAQYDAVMAEIKDLLDILARETRVLQIIKKELREIKKKFATPRRTRIAPDEGEINIADLIADETVVLTITHRGYIKRTAASEYRRQGRGGKGVKGMIMRQGGKPDEDQDFIATLMSATAHDFMMFLTNKGRAFVDRVYEIPEMGRAARGRSIKNLLNLRPDEKVASVLAIESGGSSPEEAKAAWAEDRYLLLATKKGIVKKSSLYVYRNFRKDGIIAINLDDDDELIGAALTSGNDDICLITRDGFCMRFNEKKTRPIGRVSRGVIGIRPRGDDYVVSLSIAEENKDLLVVSEKGLGKRTKFDEYPPKGKGGKGVITMKITERTGKVVRSLAVLPSDELMLMTNKGQSVRIAAGTVSRIGRNAQGVMLMRLKKGEHIQDIALIVDRSDL